MVCSTVQLECGFPWGLVLLVSLILALVLLWQLCCRRMRGSKQAQQPVVLTDVGGPQTQYK